MLDKIKKPYAKPTGFTIVEILVVIVVIAILASITIISYNAIKNRSHEERIESALTDASSKLQKYNRENGAFPVNEAAFTASIGDTSGITFTYVASSDSEHYCLAAVSDTNVSVGAYHLKSGESVKSGDCSSVTFP